MPQDELAAICVKYKATHLMLSSSIQKAKGEQTDFLQVLHFLDRNLRPDVAIWVAGRNVLRCPVGLARPFTIIRSFGHFEEEIKKCA